MGTRKRHPDPETQLREWERLSRMFNPDWSGKAKMYARHLELACLRIRQLEHAVVIASGAAYEVGALRHELELIARGSCGCADDALEGLRRIGDPEG